MPFIREPMTLREVAIIKNMKTKLKLPVTKIALAVSRHKKTVYAALNRKRAPLPRRGRPLALTGRQLSAVVRLVKTMVSSAKAKREVTIAMIKKRAKLKVTTRTLLTALHKRGIRFRRMRSKPLLTTKDKKDRYAFAKKYRNKPVSFWAKNVHLHIDCKNFPVYADARGRDYAAMREVRGAYRTRGQGLDESYVVVPKHMRVSTGKKPVKILGGVARDRVVLFHDYGPKWNGRVAASCYEGPILAALRRTWRKPQYKILEDNDPSGFKSKKVKIAKAAH